MKNLKYIAFALLLPLASCNWLLDLEPVDTLKQDELNDKHVQSLARGVYFTLAKSPSEGLIIGDCLGELIENTPESSSVENRNLSQNNLTSLNSMIKDYYYYLYSAIHQANNTIINLRAYPQQKKEYEQIIGSMHYIRGYCYFMLVTRFGGVPLVTEPTENLIMRSSTEEVWKQVINDLTYARTQCRPFDAAPPEEPELTTNKYRYASQQAAEALLARVHLFRKEYAKAKYYANQVVKNSNFALAKSTELSNLAIGSGKELIFGVLNPSGTYYYRSLFNTYAMSAQGSYQFWPAPRYIASFQNGRVNDSRFGLCVGTSVDNRTIVNKFVGNNVSTCPFTVSRLSEMYLIIAEATPDESGLKYINDLRTNRNLKELGVSVLKNPKEYLNAILDERKYEFFGENQYFYDLVRTNTVFERLLYTKKSYQFLLPIPQSQVNLGIQQNPGYQ